MSGIKNIKKLSNQYKEAEIYFHQDLDGVLSFLAMRKYLEDNKIKVMNCHIIQYGSLEFNVRSMKKGRLPVIVDFAHVKDMFIVATDHHDSQTGANSMMSTNFKKSRSNAETISDEISNGVFVYSDIELVKTIDSADFTKYNLIPEDLQRSIFNLNRGLTSEHNRFNLGFVVNRLLLSLKNKRIKIKSLDGKTHYNNRNLTECLALDSSPSLYSLYLNLKHYIKNSVSYEWNFDIKTYLDPKKLPTPEQLNINLYSYIEKRKEFILENGVNVKNKDIEYNPDLKIVRQFDIGEIYKTGSYDRYVVFKNFPDSDWVCTIYKMGLVQVAHNPFKNNKTKIHLGDITRQLLDNNKEKLSKFRISLESIKRINENEEFKLKQKFAEYDSVGFKYNDLYTFYRNYIYYLPNRYKGDLKTIERLDLDKESNDVELIKSIFNKLYSEWTYEDRQLMSWYKIPVLNIIETLSGGHPSITNLQGLNFLDERRDAIKLFYGNIVVNNKYISTYEDLMIHFSNEFIKILSEKIAGDKTETKTNIKLLGVAVEV